ncbi:MAG: YjgP/YjgQ family permease [Verrucomicrobia bacterium]|nr:YjgP/YjgQ family permease [Verrucomicrobiota bacterium]
MSWAEEWTTHHVAGQAGVYPKEPVRILYRYLTGQMMAATAGAVAVLSLIIVLGNAFKQIFELLVNDELPISLIFKMVGLLIPQALTFTMPWGILVAALIVFGRMSQDLELQAIRAAGIGLVPLVAPVILFGLFLSAVCFYNNAVVVPMTLQKFKSVLLDIGRDNPAFLIRAGEAMDRFPGYRIYIGKKNGTDLSDINIWELDPNGVPRRNIRAEKGSLSADLDDLSLTITLQKARQEERGENAADLNGIRAGLSADQLPLKISLRSFLNPDDMKDIRIAGLGDLTNRILSPVEGYVDPKQMYPMLTEMQKRISFALAPFTLLLVGIPLGIRVQRKETSVGVVISFFLVMAYYALILLAEGLKNRGGAYPELIVWMPNLLLQGYGFFLLWRANFQQS